MRVAYFDCFSGISGDMSIGAFLNAGMPLEHLRAVIDTLHLDAQLTTRVLMRSQIATTKFDVILPSSNHGSASVEQPHAEHSVHDHTHEHTHNHTHDHAHENGRHHEHGRSYATIVQLIRGSALSPRVQQHALKIFHVIGVAESKLHNVHVDDIHFHEVGAVDSIIDIVGTAIALEYFRIDRIYSSVVRLGSGAWLNTQHGPMPAPAPASIEILCDYPVTFTDIPFELTTPTGAGIIKALSTGVLQNESFSPIAIGYGAGAREIPGIANMLRVVIGEMDTRGQDDPVMLETNIDNLDPEIYPFVIERLLEAGAHDAFLIPIVMKKGRPGVLLSALVPRPLIQTALDILYTETSTIGVRIQSVGRSMLQREERTVQSSLGPVRIKEVEHNGATRRVPEYEECLRIARDTHHPLQEVRQRLYAELNPLS